MYSSSLMALVFMLSTCMLAQDTAQEKGRVEVVVHDGRPVPSQIDLLPVDPDAEHLPGVLRPYDSVQLGAPLDAPILELLKSEGDRVRKGEAVVRLDDRVANASLELARHEAAQTAAIDRARLVAERATRVLTRTEDAFDRGAANDEELTKARSEVAVAEAELRAAIEARQAARLRERQAAAHVERHVLRAPFDGVVMHVPVDEGMVVTVGDTVAELADPDSLVVDLYLPSAAAVHVQKDGRYALHLHEPTNRVLWGVATYVEPRIEPTSGTVRVRFRLDAMNAEVLAGTLVTPATRLPTEQEIDFALKNLAGSSKAYVLQNDGT